MARLIIKTPFPLEVQENDHWVIPIYVDEIFDLTDPLIPSNSVFHFAVIDKRKKLNNTIINKPNLTATLVSGQYILSINGTPIDTANHAQKDLWWETQVKTPDNRFYTVMNGPFKIIKTFIVNA